MPPLARSSPDTSTRAHATAYPCFPVIKPSPTPPALLRIARDAVGTTNNAAAIITDPTPEEIARPIIAEVRRNDRAASTVRREELDDLAQRYLDTRREDPAAAGRLLASQDATTRRAILHRIRRREMSPAERSLASMSQEARAQAIEQILDALPADERQPYHDRLEFLDLMPTPKANP